MLTSILYWAVQGAIKWYALGSNGLQTPEYIAKETKSQRDAQDFVQQWLTECCQEAKDDEKAWTPNEVVIASYTKWCEGNNVTAKKAKALAQSLQMKGYKTGVLRRDGSKVQKGVSGLKIPVSLWQTDENVTDQKLNVTDQKPVTDVTAESVKFQNPYHESDIVVSPVTSVTEDQSVTNANNSECDAENLTSSELSLELLTEYQTLYQQVARARAKIAPLGNIQWYVPDSSFETGQLSTKEYEQRLKELYISKDRRKILAGLEEMKRKLKDIAN